MDALSHCLEAYFSPVYHPMAQGVAVEGIKLVKEHLLHAVNDGSDVTARAHLQVASTAGCVSFLSECSVGADTPLVSVGATAFQKGLGAMHSLAHPLGAASELYLTAALTARFRCTTRIMD